MGESLYPSTVQIDNFQKQKKKKKVCRFEEEPKLEALKSQVSIV